MSEIRLDRIELFPQPAWRTSLGLLSEHRERMVADVCGLARHHDGRPGAQTDAVLQDRTEAHWRAFFDVAAAIASSIGEQTLIRMPLGRMISWGVVFDGPADWDRGVWSHHSHYPSTFSSVLYLQVPPELRDHGEGGTTFLDPLRHVARFFRRDKEDLLPSDDMDLVVFPSYVEHRPSPAVTAEQWSCPRVVVATDFYFFS